MAEYTLPALPYAYDALEPHIDAKTMEIHHSKHHQAYITNLNNAIKDTDLGNQSVCELCKNIDKVPENIRQVVRNNGGGHSNHSIFWTIMAPNAGGEPSGAIADAIKRDIGDFTKFKEEFKKAALGRFGSGWAWLSLDGSKKVVIHSTPNQDSPWMEGKVPLLGIDVWEHAYYLKYQNLRPSYVDAFYNVINWAKVNERLAKHS
jgi:Fe-Mn family superoxide dismutase